MKKNKQKQRSFKGMETAFAQQVYAIVTKIPKGKIMTYKEVASHAGRPNASRAIGMIMSKNRDTRVPCHRVIRTDGGMGGYAFGGVAKKRSLLQKEGALRRE
jgi:methylated-DNA-[protein]-cysteine S-methyltransferase